MLSALNFPCGPTLNIRSRSRLFALQLNSNLRLTAVSLKLCFDNVWAKSEQLELSGSKKKTLLPDAMSLY